MHQGTVRRSDPGQEAQSVQEAHLVATHLPTGQDDLRAEIIQLHQRIAQLQRRCEEADSFAHAVAHDLRSPLSAIDGFTSLLEDHLQNASGAQAEQARHLAARLRASAQHMGELIDGLQALARLSRSSVQIGPVDLSALAEQILEPIGQKQPGLQHEIEQDMLVQGDRRLLRQLLENLFDNAVKFSARSAHLHIEFGRLSEASGAQSGAPAGAFYVRDQGVGFDMAQAERLFQPYQRLHSSEQFEGLGLGLAIVQRIVTRHGGQVWARSALGQGTTVYFTLGALDAPSPLQGA